MAMFWMCVLEGVEGVWVTRRECFDRSRFGPVAPDAVPIGGTIVVEDFSAHEDRRYMSDGRSWQLREIRAWRSGGLRETVRYLSDE